MQTNENKLSNKTNQRWMLVALMTIIGIGVFASSVYFLLVPTGYQGGRNPYYGLTLLFDRETWDVLHLWTGLAIIVIAAVHIALHWDWIKMMTKRCISPKTCEIGKKNAKAQFNIYLDVLAAVSFFLAAVSGIYLMFAPSRSAAASAPQFIFSWYAWDVLHTWSGVVMFIAVFLHIYIHWGWIEKVTRRIFTPKRADQAPMMEGVQHG